MKLQTVPFLFTSIILNSGLSQAGNIKSRPHESLICLEKPLCKEEIIVEAQNCKGLLPVCVRVTSKDFLKNGEASRAHRKMSEKCDAIRAALKEPIVVCTNQAKCDTISFERFLEAVLATIRLVSNGKVTQLSQQGRLIIASIYEAGIKNEASCEHLIIFTATALHNVYLFTCFPECPDNTYIGSISRGLMQWLSYPAYSKLSSISTINFVQSPNLLNTYSKETINNEFKGYLKFYNNCNLCGIDAFIYTIKEFNSNEAPLVTRQMADEIRKGVFRPTNCLEERILSRFNIYYNLTSSIFNNRRVMARAVGN